MECPSPNCQKGKSRSVLELSSWVCLAVVARIFGSKILKGRTRAEVQVYFQSITLERTDRANEMGHIGARRRRWEGNLCWSGGRRCLSTRNLLPKRRQVWRRSPFVIRGASYFRAICHVGAAVLNIPPRVNMLTSRGVVFGDMHS